MKFEFIPKNFIFLFKTMNLGTKNGEITKFDDYIVRQGYTHSTIMQSTIVFLDLLVFMLGKIFQTYTPTFVVQNGDVPWYNPKSKSSHRTPPANCCPGLSLRVASNKKQFLLYQPVIPTNAQRLPKDLNDQLVIGAPWIPWLVVVGFTPFWKIWSSKWIISPIFGVKTKNIWNHPENLQSPWLPVEVPK